MIQKRYGVNMEETQHPKLLSEIPYVDVVITMGCGVKCPYLPCKYREDWGLEDPTGKPEETFIETVKIIEEKVNDLKLRIPKILKMPE
jgi:arsenate reductase